ncbi:hypothetical protein LCGC14_0926020 [marine sediment metagenome]|uniref:GIY-YIG domain-containing protein n=1 Tax=marine sediment metagenome TaxID=412755 RepID=A0A0F9NPI2_9ZZZZ
MNIKLDQYNFDGPYKSTASLEDRSGVYAVLTPTTNTRYKVVDVGESHQVKTRVENHDRQPCWRTNANSGGLYYAAHYTPGQQQPARQAIEEAIRRQYNPPCGSR